MFTKIKVVDLNSFPECCFSCIYGSGYYTGIKCYYRKTHGLKERADYCLENYTVCEHYKRDLETQLSVPFGW